MHCSGLNSDLKHLLKQGGCFVKNKTNKQMETLKNGQKYAIKFDRKCKNAEHRCHQQLYYKLRDREGGGYSVLVNYQSFLSNFFSLALPHLFFSINCIRNRLLRVSFIELFDFIIYQHLNKRTNILPLATSQIAHLCNQFNHVCTANF